MSKPVPAAAAAGAAAASASDKNADTGLKARPAKRRHVDAVAAPEPSEVKYGFAIVKIADWEQQPEKLKKFTKTCPDHASVIDEAVITYLGERKDSYGAYDIEGLSTEKKRCFDDFCNCDEVSSKLQTVYCDAFEHETDRRSALSAARMAVFAEIGDAVSSAHYAFFTLVKRKTPSVAATGDVQAQPAPIAAVAKPAQK
jgi:hypothetical protein